MKKLFLILTVLALHLAPLTALAESTQFCVATYGAGYTWNGSTCVIAGASNSTGQPPIVVTPNTSSGSVAAPAGTGNLRYIPLEPLPGTTDGRYVTNDLPTLLAALFKILITFGALFAVVMLVVAGIAYMLSESAIDIDKAKTRAKSALWGLLLLTMCWLILYTINPNLLRFNIFTDTVKKNTPAGSTSSAGGASNSSVAAYDAAAKAQCEASVGAYRMRSGGSWGCDYVGQY